uniref:Putative methyltransferase n=1 Tax=viral metagenome TaxID=1070528 RepID=A0A6M3L9B4_9ZZZZ
MKKFGMVQPIVINKRTGNVVAGHQRIKVLQDESVAEADIAVIDIEPTEEKALNIALNNPYITGEFTADLEDILADVGVELPELMADLNFDDLLADIGDNGKLKSGNTDPDDMPDVPEKPKTRISDLYRLSEHRLLCGDATNVDDVARLMNGEKADMVFTDPPYGVNYSAKNKFLNAYDEGNRVQEDIKNDINEKDAFELWGKAFELFANNLKATHSIYICSPQVRNLMMMMMMMMIEKGGIYISNVIIWIKNNHVFGRLDYMLKHEPIIYGWLKSKKHKFYGNGEQKFSVWNYDKPIKSKLHPTMKPVELIINAIKNSSLKNHIVADFFGGSGSTLIACEQTDRRCYMMEIDPHYCDVIVNRWENFTGEKAELINGTT